MPFALPFAWKVAALLGLVVALGMFGGWAYYHGRTDGNNAAAGVVLKETDDARKTREGIERGERDRTDDAATKCLRSPSGC